MDIDNAFTYHPPHGDQPERYVEIREGAKAFAKLVKRLTPDHSPEQGRALWKIDEAVMLANAAIARHEIPPADES
jgi:hypothetical protein